MHCWLSQAAVRQEAVADVLAAHPRAGVVMRAFFAVFLEASGVGRVLPLQFTFSRADGGYADAIPRQTAAETGFASHGYFNSKSAGLTPGLNLPKPK